MVYSRDEVYFSDEEINAIVGIFINRILKYDKDTRDYFLNGINKLYATKFLKIVSSDPIEQLESDLRILNEKRSLPDAEIPLEIWLKAVKRKLEPIEPEINFSELLNKISAEGPKKPVSVEPRSTPESANFIERIRKSFNQHINEKTVRFLVTGISAVIILIFLKVLLDQTYPGYEANIRAYEFLRSISSSSDNKESPVVVLDISDISPAPNGAVPPAELQEIIDGLFESGAKAVAVDIKFTQRLDPNKPQEIGPRHEGDFDLFDHLLKQRAKGNPVFLGVADYKAEPESWLGESQHKELAADMTCESKKCEDTSEILLWLKCGNYPKLYSIGKALADFSENNPHPVGWIEPFLKNYEGQKNLINVSLPDISGQQIPCQKALMPVNYTKLEQIENSAIPAVSKEAVLQSSSKFRNKLVIIGKARFGITTIAPNIIGRKGGVPGVFIPAMATYTLTSDPVYRFELYVSIMLDILFGMVLVFGIFIIHLWTFENCKSAQRSEIMFISAFVLVIFFLGISVVRFYNVLWLDFVLAIFAPLLHSKIKNKIDGVFFNNSDA